MNRREFLKFTAALTAAAASMYVGFGGFLKARIDKTDSVLRRVDFHEIIKDTFNKHSKVWKMHSMETLRAEDTFGHIIRGMVTNEYNFRSKWFSFMYEESKIADLEYRKTLLKNIFSAISQAITSNGTTKIKRG